MYSGGQRISSGNRTQSRRCASAGRQQSFSRQGKRTGHRGLRAGHVFRGVIRELGRPSRLLGNQTAASGVSGITNTLAWNCKTRTDHEPNRARVRRNTKDNESNQGTGREPEANRPGRTKGVAARHSTAGTETARRLARTRGEPRPKGPTITAARQREGRAGHDLRAREGQARQRVRQPVSTKLARIACEGSNETCARTGDGTPAAGQVLRNRMSESFTYGSVRASGATPAPTRPLPGPE